MSRIYNISWRAVLVFFVLACAIQTNASAHDLVICKVSDPARPVVGAFDFTITGVQGSVSVAPGACSSPMVLPAGVVTVTESPRAGSLLSAVTTCVPHPASPADAADNCGRLVTSNFIGRSATVRIVERLPFTTVTFTDEATPFVSPAGYTLTKVTITPTDLNDFGQLVGSAAAANGQTHAFRWDNGIAFDLGTLGGTTSHANGINLAGKIVGSSNTASGQEHAFFWQRGVMRDLGTLGGATSVATAINDLDEVVGSSQTATGQTHAFLWRNGQMTDLGTLIGPTGNSAATDINNREQVVGSSDASGSPTRSRAFFWENGNMRDLGGLFQQILTSNAYAINNGGVTVGSSYDGSLEPFSPVFWNQTGIHVLSGVARSIAVDINNGGQIIGNLDRHFPPNTIGYLSQNDVPTILFPQADVESSFAAINNRGQIVGTLDRFTGNGFADSIHFLLTPTTHFISDLTWSLMVNGWGPAELDMSNGEQAPHDGHGISIHGVSYAKGLGVHANSLVQYDLAAAGSCTGFLSDVGIDDETNGAGAVIFQVYADTLKLYESPVMRGGMAAQSVNVNIAGKSRLILVVRDGGQGLNSAHADWANARLTCN